ncbi:MAG: DNA topoisomerase III [Candidatus Methylacidiphilales bacterium]
MGKSLIIAEKPSVAADLARALGKFTKQNDYFENDNYLISSAVGHLLELGLPGNQKIPWKFDALPLIPDRFELHPISKTEGRLKLLKRLIARKDVTELINACDAGREGELIFRNLIEVTGCTKPIKRLWLQSMTPDAIREGFSKLRDGRELEPLADAAKSRSESDWLVGINGTRAMTAFNSKGGGFNLTTVGRVQTPTLAVLVNREKAIREFIPKGYFEIHGEFAASAGLYPGRWFDPEFKKGQNEEEKAERIWKESVADQIVAECLGKTGTVTEEKKPSSQLSPLLYDLTSLQREANGRFGLPAKRTLQIAQALYERHKAITYPRTDSRYLPEDYVGTVKSTLGKLEPTTVGLFARKVLEEGWVRPSKRIFNNAKVSDHFAIIPTTTVPTNLDEMERKLYEMIAKRFIAIFFPPAIYEVTTRITCIERHHFKTEGKILREPGWRAVYGQEVESDSEEGGPTLVPVLQGETVRVEKVEKRALQTRPPARFSEATLLSAMESAGKMVEDEELREAMAERGLGTPATRAAIIEGLLSEKYIERQGKELVPTPKAFSLFEVLEALQIPALTSPEMTGEWEYKLKRMERGQLSRPAFMEEIEHFAADIVQRAKGFNERSVQPKPTGVIDPATGQELVETLREYRTPDGSMVVRKVIAGRALSRDELQELLKNRQIGPLDGFKSRLGRPFSAVIKLRPGGETELDWGKAEATTAEEMDELLQGNPVGTCPLDGGRVVETATAYVCEHALGEEPTCSFRIGKRILGQDIPREQAAKILAEGKSDLIKGFVSNRTRRAFDAFLKLEVSGTGKTKAAKVGFEFPPREPRASGGKGGRNK